MIRVALNHKTVYQYDRKVELGPQVVRLRPAPHCRTVIDSYSLNVAPEEHFLNWQQDPHSNYLARLMFHKPARSLEVEVDLVADMSVINPFDFFLEDDATRYPFEYSPALLHDLKPYLVTELPGRRLFEFLASIDRSDCRTNDFLVAINQMLEQKIDYVIRMEPGVQSPEETLTKCSGSCRDSAWLLVQILRHVGLAARFVSGYLIQLKPDLESLDGPSGAEEDFTDLHAWTEVYLPGAGWVGLDPTSGLLAGEGHIPLACTPAPVSAAPITGTLGECEVQFHHEMSVTRIHEDPRVTKPYTDDQWQRIESTGHAVDLRLDAGDVRLTMGGEPTFVSIDDMDSAEWKTDAVGPTKRQHAWNLLERVKKRFASGGLAHYGQGKWYPGESLPRWAFTCLWRTDGQPLWDQTHLLADPDVSASCGVADAQLFSKTLTNRLNLNPDHAILAYEDALYNLWLEQRLPVNADLRKHDFSDDEERSRLARQLQRGLMTPAGCVIPMQRTLTQGQYNWVSGDWPLRADHMFLIPGDSPMGLRLPLDSLPVPSAQEAAREAVAVPPPFVPFEAVEPLPDYDQIRDLFSLTGPDARVRQRINRQVLQPATAGDMLTGNQSGLDHATLPPGSSNGTNGSHHSQPSPANGGITRTAMCIEPRDGNLHIFMPPVEHLEAYLELLAAIEQTAEELDMPVVIEGYLPPPDYRLQQLKITPDPGVVEVNVQPAASWSELVDISTGLYEDARQSRLGTEQFDLDGTHTGTGGGNHIVLGGRIPAESPFLRRPDLLRSLLAYWHNHPSLSYLFSGRFIGPTSQAPRVDEGRRDATYELQVAMDRMGDSSDYPPWLVDRVFRHLLVDLTGNTHRAELCIDKLYSPDSATGRLGLIEFRGFEMPPHWQMSLTQQLLIRSLVAQFWEQPYENKLVDWNTSIHDRWMLPHFVRQDFDEVIGELNTNGIEMDSDWFIPHFEFRFPFIGEVQHQDLRVEFRTAIEPWYVLGEEPAGGATARYVDSSVERMQVHVSGSFGDRYIVSCNGRKVPLHPTGTEGEYVAGVRYRGWQPPSCLHPNIPVDDPLTFDVIDTWHQRAIGGCKYHVGHPGGLNPDTFPVNALEAESRRAARFSKMGHSGGKIELPCDEQNARFPLTLDLRQRAATR